MGAKKVTSDHVRKKIEDSMLAAEEERKRKLAGQRLTLARNGVQAFQRHDMPTAIKSFITYLRILEDSKGVDQGGLTPQHFDMKKDLTELLMISGVYWDLVKIYDKVTVENDDFKQFMRKYIQFTKGMPFQAVCAETLRKFIANGKPKHPGEFKAAYKILGTSRCFVATSLVDVTEDQTLFTLRRFRDEFLAKKRWGRAFTIWYYRHGPSIAARVDQCPQNLRSVLGRSLDFAAILIRRTLVNDRANATRTKGELAFRKIRPE